MGTASQKRIKWFSLAITILLIIVCNGILLLGLWVSGVNLETALSKPEIFDPTNGSCIRVAWTKVVGVERPLRLCAEWLDFSDLSGNTHSLRQEETLAIGADGQLYYQIDPRQDYRFFGLVIFVIVVIGSGMWVKHVLITKYQGYLDQPCGKV